MSNAEENKIKTATDVVDKLIDLVDTTTGIVAMAVERYATFSGYALGFLDEVKVNLEDQRQGAAARPTKNGGIDINMPNTNAHKKNAGYETIDDVLRKIFEA